MAGMGNLKEGINHKLWGNFVVWQGCGVHQGVGQKTVSDGRGGGSKNRVQDFCGGTE